jgi:MYXO-CTERM domain-containing protein
VRVTGGAADGNPTCGDGVDVEIRHGSTVVWSYGIDNGDEDGTTYDLALDVTAGDVLTFRISQRLDNYCDSTLFAPTISWDDGSAHDWSVTTAAGSVALPPSGFVAEGADGFVARSALLGGRRTDFVRSPEYLYAGVRDGVVATIENVAVDGAIAFVAGPYGEELHATALTSADRDGLPALRVSARADVNVRLLDARRALVVVRHAAGAVRVDVNWGAYPAAWQAVLAAHPDEVEWAAADDAGTPIGPTTPLDASGGFLGLGDLAVDQPYLVRITSPCVVEAECGAGEGCIEGRCVPGAADGDADADGDGGPDADADVEAGADGDADGDGGTDGGPPAGGGDGCGCSMPGAGAGLGALLLLAPLLRRRRRIG